MDEELLAAARQMYLSIVHNSGICFEPCEHDDCQYILASAAHWLELDPLSTKLAQYDHPRFDQDIEPITDTDALEFLADEVIIDDL